MELLTTSSLLCGARSSADDKRRHGRERARNFVAGRAGLREGLAFRFSGLGLTADLGRKWGPFRAVAPFPGAACEILQCKRVRSLSNPDAGANGGLRERLPAALGTEEASPGAPCESLISYMM